MEFNNMPAFNKRTILLASAVTVLVLVFFYLGFQYFTQAKELKEIQGQIKIQQNNAKIISFLDLFIQKVLKSDKEISFEDRLKLENAIRAINDTELLSKWEQFTGGTNEAQIQQGVKDLLEALVKKISY